MSTGIGLRGSYPPPYNGILRSNLTSPTRSPLPAYQTSYFAANQAEPDFAQLSRGVAPAPRAGSVLRTKIVVGIDFGTT